MGTTTILVRIAEANRPEDWEAFVQAYQPRLAAWCRRRYLNADGIDDVVQTVFAHLARSIRTFRRENEGRPTVARAWVKRVCQNAISDYVEEREKAGQPMLPDEVDRLCSPESIAELTAEIECGHQEDLRRIAVRRATEEDPNGAIAAQLLKCQDMTGPEVATKIGISTAAAFKRAHRFMARVREIHKELENRDSVAAYDE